MEIGDKILYIYNIPFQGNSEMNGASGVILDINNSWIGDGWIGYYECRWKSKKGRTFHWAVPKIYVRKLKDSDLS